MDEYRDRDIDQGQKANGKDGSGRPDVFDVTCPNCGYLNAQLSNGSFTHLRCKNSKCKCYFSGYMVEGVFICIEGKGRSHPIMQTAPRTFVG